MARGRVTADTVNALQAGLADQFLWDDKLALDFAGRADACVPTALTA